MDFKQYIVLATAALLVVLTVIAVVIWGGEEPPNLMDPGPLPEMALGDSAAPITIVEYASMTCGHCGEFHLETLPELEATYVVTGKVRLIYREFPLDSLATMAFMLARCAGEDRYFAFIDALFRFQDQWTRSDTPVEELRKIARMGGFTNERFESCTQDQALLANINAIKDHGLALGVGRTPTFFINGEKQEGHLRIAKWREILDPLLAASTAAPNADESSPSDANSSDANSSEANSGEPNSSELGPAEESDPNESDSSEQ